MPRFPTASVNMTGAVQRCLPSVNSTTVRMPSALPPTPWRRTSCSPRSETALAERSDEIRVGFRNAVEDRIRDTASRGGLAGGGNRPAFPHDFPGAGIEGEPLTAVFVGGKRCWRHATTVPRIMNVRHGSPNGWNSSRSIRRLRLCVLPVAKHIGERRARGKEPIEIRAAEEAVDDTVIEHGGAREDVRPVEPAGQ